MNQAVESLQKLRRHTPPEVFAHIGFDAQTVLELLDCISAYEALLTTDDPDETMEVSVCGLSQLIARLQALEVALTKEKVTGR